MKKKGENLATKEDVAALTRQLESVKAEIAEQQSVRAAKYRLKPDACLKALSLIDAMFSHQLQDPGGNTISKQYATTKEARECHSMLILSCKSTELLVKFAELAFGPKDKLKPAKPPTDALNEFRNLVRNELGFGRELELDRERAWFGKKNWLRRNQCPTRRLHRTRRSRHCSTADALAAGSVSRDVGVSTPHHYE